MGTYPTEPIKCWNKAKELRGKYYDSVVKARENGGLIMSGSGSLLASIVQGFGKDVAYIAGEPYGATVATHPEFSVKAMEALEKYGYARDLCAYVRNYLGSILLNTFILPDGTKLEWPKVDVFCTHHICCAHAKWFQIARELQGDHGILVGVDEGCRTAELMEEASHEYYTSQITDVIEKIEKYTGRKFNDELFIESVTNEMTSLSLWGRICAQNQNIPAPLDEKTMFSLYVLNVLCPHWKEVAEFYQTLAEEVEDRVKRGIAAVANERFRFMHDSQPPWAFLKIFREMEKYGAVSVGSIYSIGLAGFGFGEAADGKLIPPQTPAEKGLKLRTREEAIAALVEKEKNFFLFTTWSSCTLRIKYALKFARQFRINAVIMHLNRGCEGAGLGQMETREELIKAGIPVLTYEGNMGDTRDFDYDRTMSRVRAFLESQGLTKLEN
ncbi:2-hydroxyacyl-CoA dehydratase subunit D [Chloroflexota bacterium]